MISPSEPRSSTFLGLTVNKASKEGNPFNKVNMKQKRNVSAIGFVMALNEGGVHGANEPSVMMLSAINS